ncbi:LysM peptidoglycan-binding domain-containing protein [Winogradskyella sp.]|uniref:LysM peptidoglycan-binding domain-containing protein n=1 Tax=Winogradskyella sp. TaxID=1883156 RepID=UPI0025F06223|nr:LysM peptidoglycan-binding domain-containing protein [Winogradskyella sp.]
MYKAKYQAVLDLGEQLNIKDGKVEESADKLMVWGTASTQYAKDAIWNKIKEIGGDNPSDIMADIKVEDESVYARHTVVSGDTLGKIAKHYYGDAMKYKEIFAANTNILSNPDVIHPDQELVIPNL